ncbi:unnamed protein product [Microthlaspi erraticum]|uniref:Reverse transcriptase domain-containing protein n=1 Tax=Microthlaspi erraticum TaxID=1685480 RepID=A0A6D2HDP7_9BRAS|nr:unnamed protein product [Microthlaspi erraticum]CAA7034506.1 unnamed protein product [Microthlaspi erraticum]
MFFSTFVYGDPDRGTRKRMWEYLTDLAIIRDSPWFLTGDFNDLIDNSEKEGGPMRAEGTFGDFRTFLSEGDCSDHRPIVSFFDPKKKKSKGLFRYDRRLKDNEEVTKLVAETWSERADNTVNQKIDSCRKAIVLWNKKQQQNSQKRLEELKKGIDEEMSSSNPNETRLLKLNEDLKTSYAAEKSYWKQRSRQLWLKLGDNNTSYFHAVARSRFAMNKFSVLEDDNENVIYEEDQMIKVISNYFQTLFTSKPVPANLKRQIIEAAIEPVISDEMNQLLISDPSEQEIKEAMFSIHPDKAPGPDGFSASFFQTNWSVVGPDIITEVQTFFTSGIMPRSSNDTHIRLIPKILAPKRVADYRPIALCNVCYKVISKLLSRRLQPLLELIISETQSAFVPKRAISDNVLITHEVLHYLKVSKAKVSCSMAVKTDMSKAYDRLEWDFIELVMRRFGFHEKWIDRVLSCITIVSYSILFNGTPRGKIVPSRGIRQGDPLSPYLFIICSEILSGLCRKAQASGKLEGLKVARGSPQINHLLFADDTMFFCKANSRSCKELKKILDNYEMVSGQLINLQKSSVTFSSKTPLATRNLVKGMLLIEKEGGVGKYLGLPEHFGRKKKDLFTAIVDRIRQKAASWSTKRLSSAGKMIMLKSVLASMPSYAMSCFKLPQSLCKRIQSALTRFWWDSDPEKKKMCWISWEKMAKPKHLGGLGFKDINNFNDALLAKLSWCIQNNPLCLLARILKGKYHAHTSFMENSIPNSASHGWRSICTGRELLIKKLGWVIGNGKSIKVWEDPLLFLKTPCTPIGPPTQEAQNLTVSDLFFPNSVIWDPVKLQLYLPEYKEFILTLKPSRLGAPDKLRWLGNPSGDYSTRSGYLAAAEAEELHLPLTPGPAMNWNQQVWGLKTSPKVKVFIWKTLQGALPVGTQLEARCVPVDPKCCRCGEPESILHLLFHCSFAKAVWEKALFSEDFVSTVCSTVREGLAMARTRLNLPPIGLDRGALYPWICWALWIARNQKIFEQRIFTIEDTILRAFQDAREWNLAQAASSPPIPPPNLPVRLVNLPTRQHWRNFSCCTDAAWTAEASSSAGSTGLGWIFSFNEEVISSHSSALSSISSALVAEALAIREALTMARDKGFNSLTLHSDFQILIKAIIAKSSLIEVHGILEDIRLIESAFVFLKFKFIPRRFNFGADSIAKQALRNFNSVAI